MRKWTSEHDEFFTTSWRSFYVKLLKALLLHPSFGFLRGPVISYTMVAKGWNPRLSFELGFLKRMFPNEFLKATLQEDLVGGPVLIRSEYCTSANSVHHLFHLARFMQRTGCRPKDVRTVMEIWQRFFQERGNYMARTLPT
jgi:hypothetical protein